MVGAGHLYFPLEAGIVPSCFPPTTVPCSFPFRHVIAYHTHHRYDDDLVALAPEVHDDAVGAAEGVVDVCMHECSVMPPLSCMVGDGNRSDMTGMMFEAAGDVVDDDDVDGGGGGDMSGKYHWWYLLS